MTRFGYGVDATLAKDVRKAGGAAAWFEKQLTRPGAFPDASADSLRRWWPDLDRKPRDLWQRQVTEVRGGYQVMEDYGRWLLVRRIRTRRPVLEKMTEFWEGMLHVPVSGDAHFTWRAAYGETVRAHALGRFDELLTATTTHPAMLIFLSAATSTKRAPNENLGRELLELHTLGAGNYSEDDVKASARILTGWHVDLWESWSRSYVKEDHYTGTVKVRGFTHNNRKADGREVTREYLRYLAHHPDTARHVCERLATKFVRDDPPRGLVERLAKVYLRNDTEIVPVLRALVASKEFRASAGKKLRDPSEDVVATYRALGVGVGRPTRNDSAGNAVLWQASGLGLSPHAWPRPDGTPVTDAVWASPSRALGSMSMHWSMAGGWWPSHGLSYREPKEWVPAKKPVRFKDLVDDVSRDLLHRPASKRLLETACLATGCTAKEKIDREHGLYQWGFPRLLAAVLDSPDHLAC
ncbi:uncharacterized protein (DUF1800 family) [Nocardioides cavernae]|uniref:Uncharacterized protein (DUF1800 family) n=1 Tax=Nocardioides cavernae TaxID=1921566 RepID=A0A7Y9KUG1_9ACTN|nr:DUF1800 domain-containing protein [Nocardioides cavernae]NYE37873.1 uncharacterized protein (DUF1800 family) [Nocardioides cavernae]